MDSVEAFRGWCRVRWLRLRGRRIVVGRGFRARGLEVIGPGTLIIGDDCRVTSIPTRNAVFRTYTPEATIRLGNGVAVHGTWLGTRGSIEVGSGAYLADAQVMDSPFLQILGAGGAREGVPEPSKPIVIGEGARIGTRSMVLNGVTVGAGASIAPGSVVLDSVPPEATASGNPAQIVEG